MEREKRKQKKKVTKRSRAYHHGYRQQQRLLITKQWNNKQLTEGMKNTDHKKKTKTKLEPTTYRTWRRRREETIEVFK